MKKITILLFFILVSIITHAQASQGFTLLKNVSALTYVDSTCPDMTSCFYEVTAVDSSGHESQPAPCSTGQLCFNGNQAIAQMPSSGTHTVTLTWTASPTSGVTYNVYSHIGPTPPGGIGAVVN